MEGRVTHKKVWRRGILLLMLISIAGPWIYDLIAVPSPYPCSTGFRVNETLCGIPQSGMRLFFTLLMNFFSVTYRLVIGEAGGREFLFFVGTVIFISVPVAGLLMVSGKGDESIKREKIHIGILSFSVLLGVWGVVIVNLRFDAPFILELWGIWLYTLLVVTSLVLELSTLVMLRRKIAYNRNAMM